MRRRAKPIAPTRALTEDDIGDEKDAQNEVVLNVGKAKLLVHAFDLGIANVGSIKVSHHVEDSQEGDEAPVNLSQHWSATHRQ